MYEYEIFDRTNGEHDFIWGYSWENALRRANLEERAKAGEITCLYYEYID